MPGLDLPREKIPWFPVIDRNLCTADRDCLEFCKQDVFEWNESMGLVFVARPYNCVVGCDACARLCIRKAITFPSKEELRLNLQRLRAEAAPPPPRQGESS